MDSCVLENTGEDPSDVQCSKKIQDLPIPIFHQILSFLPSTQDGKKNLRLVSRYWNDLLTNPAAGGPKLIFTYDGNTEANEELFLTNVVDYFIRSGWANVTHGWQSLCIQNACFWKLSAWIQVLTTGHVRSVEFKNCSIQLNALMDLLSQFVNMESFTYKSNPDAIDIANDLSILAHYQYIENPEILQHLENLQTLNIYTGLETEILILKYFNSYCTNIQNLSIRIKKASNAKTSSNESGAWTTENLSTLLENIGTTLEKNQHSLKNLHLAFEAPTTMNSEVNISERLFVAINELRWDAFEFPNLESACISYPAELNPSPDIDPDLSTYFFRFLRHLISRISLKTLEIGTICIDQQHTYKHLVDQLETMKTTLNPKLSLKLGVFLQYDLDERFENDKVLGESLSSMVIESSVRVGRIGRVLANSVAPNLKRLSILNRTKSLTDYGINTLTTKYYSSLRILEIDEMSVSTTDEVCSAKIEDGEIQGIFRDLLKLETLKLSVNMEGVSDSGLTGYRKCSCEMHQNSAPDEKLRKYFKNEPRGYPISNLKALRHLLLRGVGKRVTNLTFYFGLDKMTELRDLTIIGKHKITGLGISYLKERAGNSNLIEIITS